jgi:hypothetical protein
MLLREPPGVPSDKTKIAMARDTPPTVMIRRIGSMADQ